MLEKFSLRVKLVGGLVLLLLGIGALFTVVSYIYSSRMAENIIDRTLQMKIQGDVHAARLYVQKHFGKLQYANGQIMDAQGRKIAGRHDMVDEILQDLGVVATVFAKDGQDYRRITTNIHAKDGSRAVGTYLGSESAAYEPIRNGELYIGQADILNKPYFTAYDPIFDKQNEVVGILFIGIPQAEINAIAQKNMNAIFRNGTIAFVLVLACCLAVGGIFSSRLSKKIKMISEKMDAAAKAVASASKQVASSSQTLAEGTNEQASSLEESSSSLEQISSQTRQNAEHGRKAERSRDEARASLQEGVKAMNETSQAMDRISERGEEIRSIIKTIDDISFQTNLLALNAAVEAARAGEAGKGFAVVAEEVRNLAQRSAKAAQDTQELIEKTIEEIKAGSGLLGQTKQAFDRTVEQNKKVGQLIEEIATATDEQAQGIEQVNTAVAEMDKVVQQNASDSEEMASAAQEMSSRAEEMNTLVQELNILVTGIRNQAFIQAPVREEREPGRQHQLQPGDGS